MKLFNLLTLISLCMAHAANAETALAAAVAHDHAAAQAQQSAAQSDNQTNQPSAAAENKTPVTDALVNLGIQLKEGYNFPAPGLQMELYPIVNGDITVETKITIDGDDAPHPLVAQILTIIGYKSFEDGYIFCTEPKVSKSDACTTIVSIKRPYAYSSLYKEVHVKLRTILNLEQTAKYAALLKDRVKERQMILQTTLNSNK